VVNVASGESGREAFFGPSPRLGRLDLAVLRRGRGDEPVEQRPRRRGDRLNRLLASAFAWEGLVEPLILRTYCRAEAWISSSVAGGSKLWRVLMFLHISRS